MYIADAWADFSYFGVICFSIVVGMICRGDRYHPAGQRQDSGGGGGASCGLYRDLQPDDIGATDVDVIRGADPAARFCICNFGMSANSSSSPLRPSYAMLVCSGGLICTEVGMSGRSLVGLIDSVLGWRSRSSGAVSVGQGATIAWRRIRRVAGNHLSIGNELIIHADISFEERGGEVRIGSRTFIGRSNLVCYRKLIIGDDVIMSWGVTIVDHDSSQY